MDDKTKELIISISEAIETNGLYRLTHSACGMLVFYYYTESMRKEEVTNHLEDFYGEVILGTLDYVDEVDDILKIYDNVMTKNDAIDLYNILTGKVRMFTIRIRALAPPAMKALVMISKKRILN